MHESDANVLEHVCRLLSDRKRDAAERVLKDKLPFEPGGDDRPRRYTESQMLRVFLKDGFIDRYDGSRLVFPPVLRTLSLLFPDAFPYHPNWKFGACHEAWWRLFPTLDHLEPVARGGRDEPANWMTTSMLNNSVKAHWTLEELKWSLSEPGDLKDWDGLLGWFLDFEKHEPALVRDTPYLLKWRRAALEIPRA